MCLMHRPLLVTLFLACTALAQQPSLNARVEQHLGGVSERAIELTLDRPFLVSVWRPVEFGERRLQVGGIGVSEQILTVESENC